LSWSTSHHTRLNNIKVQQDLGIAEQQKAGKQSQDDSSNSSLLLICYPYISLHS